MKNLFDVLGREFNPADYVCYVTMTDKAMSGWGVAKGKTAKRVYPCKTLQIARDLISRIERRCPDMIYLNISYNLPRYAESRYTTTFDLGAETSWTY
jgi:hypothetical protein